MLVQRAASLQRFALAVTRLTSNPSACRAAAPQAFKILELRVSSHREQSLERPVTPMLNRPGSADTVEKLGFASEAETHEEVLLVLCASGSTD